MNKEKTIKAWLVLGGRNDKGGIAHHNYPMIFIQKTKPKVWKIANEKAEKVVRCEISYTP
jgi:hypothetical protein